MKLKRCPTCNKTFTDQNLSFCIEDGTPLVPADTSGDDEAPTLILRSAGDADSASEGASSSEGAVPAYQPPGSYVPPGSSPNVSAGQNKRRSWTWIVSILVIVLLAFAGLGFAGVLLLPRMRTALSNRHNSNHNANVERRESNNSNLDDSDTSALDDDENGNDNSGAQDSDPPPTNEGEVLTALTELEHEWTVANINADKKKLNRILADDYVGTTEGKAQGKAEYLKTIERDTTIQKWDFEDLKVSLKGDRATLTGIIRLVVQDQNVAYRFTDKFVWRDNRWQATSSEVSPMT